MVENIKFQYYPANIFSKKPEGMVTLKQFLESQKNPKQKIIDLFMQIQEAGRVGNDKLKNELKSKLFFFIPSCVTNGIGRGYEDVIGFNPFMVVEYDKLSQEEATYLKYRIFQDFPSCIASYLSPSRKGVKFIFHIRVPESIEDYKSLYFGLVYFLSQIKEGVDESNERITQPLYLSWDENLLYRENTIPWTKRGGKICTTKYDPELADYTCDENISDNEVEYILKKLKKRLGNVVDDGHNNLIKIATLAGGYVSGYGFPESAMIEFFYNQIENHPYYKKDINNYKKTALRFIKSGQRLPILKPIKDE